MNRRYFFKALASGIAAVTSAELFLPKLIKPVWKPLIAANQITLFDPLYFKFTPIAVQHMLKDQHGLPTAMVRELYDESMGVQLDYPTSLLIEQGVKQGEIVDVHMGSAHHRILVEDMHHSSPVDGESISAITGRIVPSAASHRYDWPKRETKQVVTKEIHSSDWRGMREMKVIREIPKYSPFDA